VTSLMATIFGCPRYTVNLSLRTGVPQPQLARRSLERPYWIAQRDGLCVVRPSQSLSCLLSYLISTGLEIQASHPAWMTRS